MGRIAEPMTCGDPIISVDLLCYSGSLALLSTSFLMLASTRRTLARISSAVAVQTNGLALLFQCVM